MISVLVPVFNRDVVELVMALHRQLMAVPQQGEILVMDDGSTDERAKIANRQVVETLTHVRYIELPVNTGRNVIRHRLAAAAVYDTLIFLDADSSFPDAFWLQRYLDALTSESIIIGGRVYTDHAAGSSTLHYWYGLHREQRTAARKNKHPFRSFLACNFMIPRNWLARLIIDTRLQGYCHEDTFMGLQFEKLHLPVRYIDNPVFHDGIDPDELFMNKQQEALENLVYLYNTYHTQYNFGRVKLVRFYQFISATAAGRYVLTKLVRSEIFLRKKTLQSRRLFWMDCWKLAVYHRLAAMESRISPV